MNNHRGQIIFIVTMIFILLVTFTGLSATDTNDTTDNQSDNYKHVLTNNTIHDTNNIKVNKNIKNNAVDNNTNITNDTQTPQNDTIDNNTNITASNQTTEITRKNTKINITNVKTDNTSVILSADITDSQGNSVTVGKAIFKINGKTVSNKLDVINGTVTFNYTANGLSAKNYTITTVYGGNEQYFPSKASGTLTILKKNTKIKVANIKSNNSTIKLTAYITDKNNMNVTGGNIVFKINGKTVSKKILVCNGVASSNYNIKQLGVKNYTIIVTYSGSSNYYSSTSKGTLTVTKRNTIIKIAKTKTKPGSNVTFNANITGAYGDKINNGNVVFKINGITISPKINVHNGKVSYTYTVPKVTAKNYTITATFSGNSNYLSNKVNQKLEMTQVKHDPFKMSIPTVQANFNNKTFVPDVEAMSTSNVKYKWLDTTKTYIITKAQYKEVMDRDSKTMQINSYHMSKYTAFKTKDEPNVYHVVKREVWNTIEEAFYYRQLKYNAEVNGVNNPYPSEIRINFKAKTLEAKRPDGKWSNPVKFKNNRLENKMWFCADVQNTGYTCGPTTCSEISQYYHKFYSEQSMQASIKATSWAGSEENTHMSKLRAKGFKCIINYPKSGFNSLKSWLSAGKCAEVHVYHHYVAAVQIDNDKNHILILNPSVNTHGVPTGWCTTNGVYKAEYKKGFLAELNWEISKNEISQLKAFYNSMGGDYTPKITTSETPRQV